MSRRIASPALQHIASYCRRFHGTDQLANDAIAGCSQLAPDSRDMVTALKRLARAPDRGGAARLVLNCGAAIIDADGRHAPEEVRWAVEISNTLNAMAMDR